MLDRQDLDALLVGALYGELTPADSERLAQHLEAHPADKVVLDDMTRARKAVQESRIFAAMSEPPQAVSALLLQEAHRRAPRSAVAREQGEAGWFVRFVRSFAAHPAMAAATMLVLVAGVAGTLYVRNGQLGADEKTVSTQAQAAPAGAPTVAPSGKTTAANLDPSAAAGSAGYVAQLDETVRESEQKLQDTQDQAERLRSTATSHLAKSGGMGVTVHRPEPTVKDLPGDNDADSAQPTTIATDDRPSPAKAAAHAAATPTAPAPHLAPDVDIAGATGGAPAQETRSAPTPPPAVASQAPVAAPPPPPPPAPSANGPGQSASDASLVAWAAQQKARVIDFVKANNCYDAANVALQIQGRAPDYYDQNVATDRTVQKCSTYISSARARQADEAQKRASKVDAADSKK